MVPLTKTDLLALISNGENSAVEFKRDSNLRPESLAKELVAFGNFEGGRILLGIDDDGTISGLQYSAERDYRQVEEWVMQVCRAHVQPGIIPFFQLLTDVVPGRDVAVIEVARAFTVLRHSNARYYIRIGSTSAEMNSDELARLFQRRGLVRADVQPIGGSGLDDLDRGRLQDYFRRFRRLTLPELADTASWERLLLNTELMVEDSFGAAVCSVAGLLLFGKNPNRFLPQAGITAAAFSGTQKEYVTPQRLRGPLVGLFRDTGAGVELIEPGVIDRALAFVQQHAADPEELVGGIRTQRWHYPKDAVREAIVNAAAHRDYLLGFTDIELALYADRLEVISPGRLPNGITPERMREGCRADRNQLVKDTLKDYQYMEHMGLGIHLKIIPLMRAFNGTEPDLVVDGDRFTVRLWRGTSRPSA